jgi:hypothetical protein
MMQQKTKQCGGGNEFGGGHQAYLQEVRAK